MDEPLLICVGPDGQRHHDHVDFRAVEKGRCSAIEHGRRCGNAVAIFEGADPELRQRAFAEHGVAASYRVLIRQGVKQRPTFGLERRG